MEVEGEGKFTSMSTSKIESIKVLKKINVPDFQAAGDASLLHRWHVFMSMLG